MNIPHDEQLETAILGAAIRDGDGLAALLRLNAEDFYKPLHAEAYKAIAYLSDASAPVNLTTVSSRLRESRMLDVVGGIEVLREWLGSAGRDQPAFYAEKLRDLSARRKLIELSAAILTGAQNEEEPLDTVLDSTVTALQSIAAGEATAEPTFGEGMRATLDRITEGVRSGRQPIEISTGIAPLDYWTAGLHRQEMTVIAGRTSAGKTTLAVQIACHVAKHTGPVLLFSLEMPREEINKRLYALETSVNMRDIRALDLTEGDLRAMELTWRRLNNVQLVIDDTSDVSLRTVRLKVRQMRTPPALIVVDYIQIMRMARVKQDNRTRELDEASRTLKLMARDFKCPVIVLSQLNRAVGMSEDKRPSLEHLRESGGIANNADNVLFVHSASYDAKPGVELPAVVDAEIIIAKQRNGPRNVKAVVQWHPSYLRFGNPSDHEDPFAEEEPEQAPRLPYAEAGG